MILQNLSKAVREQNYYAVVLEFVIVIAGVVIGFQINAWNEGRQVRADEAQYLRALEADIRFSHERLIVLRGNLTDQQTALEALHDVHRGDIEPDPEQLSRWLADGLFYLSALQVSQTTFDTLVASGRLNVIGDPGLVAALLELESAYDNTRTTIDNEYQVTYRFSDPVLLGLVDMGPVFMSDPGYAGHIPWLEAGEPTLVDPAVLAERSFGNVVLYRANFSGQVLGQVNGLISDLDGLGEQLRSRIDTLDGRP